MAYVTPREGESPESLVNRFRASVQHPGILRDFAQATSSIASCGWP